MTQVEVVSEQGVFKSPLEILIERIHQIQGTLKKHEENLTAEERAFTEAAENYQNPVTQKAGLLHKK